MYRVADDDDAQEIGPRAVEPYCVDNSTRAGVQSYLSCEHGAPAERFARCVEQSRLMSVVAILADWCRVCLQACKAQVDE